MASFNPLEGGAVAAGTPLPTPERTEVQASFNPLEGGAVAAGSIGPRLMCLAFISFNPLEGGAVAAGFRDPVERYEEGTLSIPLKAGRLLRAALCCAVLCCAFNPLEGGAVAAGSMLCSALRRCSAPFNPLEGGAVAAGLSTSSQLGLYMFENKASF